MTLQSVLSSATNKSLEKQRRNSAAFDMPIISIIHSQLWCVIMSLRQQWLSIKATVPASLARRRTEITSCP